MNPAMGRININVIWLTLKKLLRLSVDIWGGHRYDHYRLLLGWAYRNISENLPTNNFKINLIIFIYNRRSPGQWLIKPPTTFSIIKIIQFLPILNWNTMTVTVNYKSICNVNQWLNMQIIWLKKKKYKKAKKKTGMNYYLPCHYSFTAC